MWSGKGGKRDSAQPSRLRDGNSLSKDVTGGELGELLAVCQRVENECLVTAKEEQEEQEGDEFLALRKRMYETIRNTQILIEDRREIRASKGTYKKANVRLVRRKTCLVPPVIVSSYRVHTLGLECRSFLVVREPCRTSCFHYEGPRDIVVALGDDIQRKTDLQCILRVFFAEKEVAYEGVTDHRM